MSEMSLYNNMKVMTIYYTKFDLMRVVFLPTPIVYLLATNLYISLLIFNFRSLGGRV